MDKRYNLIGTPEELVKLLQKEFDMQEKQAVFYVTLLLSGENNPAVSEETCDLALWYVDQNTPRYQTPILNSRINISFSELKKSFAEVLFDQFAAALDGSDKISATLIFSCLKALYKSGTYVKEHQCCVYYQALLWRATHSGSEYFSVDDIFPSGNEGYCLHLADLRSEKWECHHCHDEKCCIRRENFSTIVSQLVDSHVFAEYNNMYRFEV